MPQLPEWYYSRGEDRIGPVTAAELKQLARSGKIGPDDLIWKEGLKEWMPARKVKGLFPTTPTREPPSVPVSRGLPRRPSSPPTDHDPPLGPFLRGQRVKAAVFFLAAPFVIGMVTLIILTVLLRSNPVLPENGKDNYRAETKNPPSNSGPAAQPPDPQSREYHTLAQLLTHDYRLDRATVAPEPQKPDLERMAKLVREKGMQRAATLFLQGIQQFDAEAEAARNADEARIRRAEETLAAARRGELTRTEMYWDYDASGNLRQREVQVDASLLPVFFSSIVLSSRGPKDPERETWLRRIALDGSRAHAWDEILPAVPEKLTGPPSKTPLVNIEFLRDGPGGRSSTDPAQRWKELLPCRDIFHGRYVARNVTGRDLHNVTFAVEMFHYSTLPEATLRHVYFVPCWHKDATLEFSRTFFADPKRGGRKYNVPALEVRPEGGGINADVELSMMAGVVKMQAAVWCDEARQPTTGIELPERARIVASKLLELAEKRVVSIDAVTPKGPPPVAPAPQAQFGLPPLKSKTAEEQTQMLLERLLRPVPAFLPADADLTKRANRMLDDFLPVREELLKKNANALFAACEEGKRYTGQWFGPGVTGDFGLLFVSSDAACRRIRAEVFYLKRPRHRRLLAGFIATDPFRQEKVLMLEPLVPNQGADPDALPQYNILHAGIRSYCFRLVDGDLVGEATSNELPNAARGPIQRFSISLKESVGDPFELTEARKRNEAAPKTPPREPFPQTK